MHPAICDVLKNVAESEHFINDVADWIESLPRHMQSFKSFDKDCTSRIFEGLPSYEAHVIFSHLDPQSFYQVYPWYCMALASRLRLSYLELVGLQTTFDLHPKSHYYFDIVFKSILMMETKLGEELISHHCGYRFEYFILSSMFEMQGKFATLLCRFIDYKTLELHSWDKWVNIIDKNVLT